MKYLFVVLGLWISGALCAQVPDSVYMHNIASAKLYLKGNQMGYPVLSLGGGDRLMLEFDDLDADVKNYSYTYQLCNADWSPVQVSTFDYIRGFAQNQITDYHYSSIAEIKYTHYQVQLPDVNSNLIASGNFMLKVYLNNDTSQLAFTKRILVVQNAVSIDAKILQPMNPQFSYTHQKIQFTVNTRALSISSPFQQIRVVVLQNDRWDNAIFMGNPSFYSGSKFEYNSDETPVFEAGNQWRWFDIQSFRFQSDRIAKVDYQKTGDIVFIKPDKERSSQPYFSYSDYNGKYFVQTTDLYNSSWQGDYGRIKFTFIPPDNLPLENKDLYMIGEFNGYKLDNTSRMIFNNETRVYEGAYLLKMGYYNYEYVTVDKSLPDQKPTVEFTEGNHFETENNYSILVYYRTLGGRADQLVGIYSMNSFNNIR